MRQDSYQLSIFIEAPWEKVYTFLANLPNYAQIHPLIVDIREVPKPELNNNSTRHFKVRDKLLLWKFPVHVTYLTVTTLKPPYEIVSEAYQFPRVFLQNYLRCEPNGLGTKVSEQVFVRAPNLLHNYTIQQAKEAHWQSFLRLKLLFEDL